MKKIISSFALLCVTSLQAIDLEINMGTGAYYTGSEGKLVYAKDFWQDSSGNMDHNLNTTLYGWAEIESDQKYWPKLRLEVSQLKTEGESVINILTDNETINELMGLIDDYIDLHDYTLPSRLTQTNLEAYLYYEYFEDTAFPTFGMGMGLKKFDFDYAVTIIEGLQFNDNGGDVIPLLFFKSRYMLDKKMNGSSVAFETHAKVYVFGDSTVYDYIAKVDFMMKYNNDTNIGMELGYKETYFDIKGQDIDSVGGNMKTSGPYIGLVAHFK